MQKTLSMIQSGLYVFNKLSIQDSVKCFDRINVVGR